MCCKSQGAVGVGSGWEVFKTSRVKSGGVGNLTGRFESDWVGSGGVGNLTGRFESDRVRSGGIPKSHGSVQVGLDRVAQTGRVGLG